MPGRTRRRPGQAQGLIHTLAATLAHMDRHAAYLVLRRDSRSGELHLDSLRTAGGRTLCSFDERDLLPELTDPSLRAAWGRPTRATRRPCSSSFVTSTGRPRSRRNPG
ncbi:hypothetical protein ACFWA6_09465 [Streptomyces sp. NPDC060020]|uniref:hypothetical protein n=1 Tax=Streptomyces sp. NPDC060020 TaxID=3347038 RepID=UPI0036C4BC2E